MKKDGTFLSSRFYPVNSTLKVIFDDPQRTEGACSDGPTYGLFKNGTIGLKGDYLNKTAHLKRFDRLPPHFIREWSKTHTGFMLRDRSKGCYEIERHSLTGRCSYSFREDSLDEARRCSEQDYATFYDAAAACLAEAFNAEQRSE